MNFIEITLGFSNTLLSVEDNGFEDYESRRDPMTRKAGHFRGG